MEVNGRYYVKIGKLIVSVSKFSIEKSGDISINEIELKKRVEKEARAGIVELIGGVDTSDDCEFVSAKPKGEPDRSNDTIRIWEN